MEVRLKVALFLLVSAPLFLFTHLAYNLHKYEFKQQEFFSLQEQEQLIYYDHNYQEHIDGRENSLFFLFSRRVEPNPSYLVVPRFKVINNQIFSIAEFYSLEQKKIISFERLSSWRVNEIADLIKDYSFVGIPLVSRNQHFSEQDWAELLSIVFAKNIWETLRKRWHQIWAIEQLRELFFGQAQQYDYQLVQLGNQKFIFFKSQENEYHLLSMNAQDITLYKIRGSLSQVRELCLNYFSKAQWFNRDFIFPFPESDKQFTVFTILDFFTFKKLLAEHRQLIEHYLIDYFNNLLLPVGRNNSVLLKRMLFSLQELQVLTMLKDNRGELYYSDAFRLDLKRLILQLEGYVRE